jgi:putative ABC transport system permease protein
MLRTILAGLRAHKLRLLSTTVAIVLGVGFVAGTLVFGNTVRAALYDQFARTASHVDVAVRPPAADRDKDPVLALSTLDTVRSLSGVSAADGRMEEPLPLLDKRGKLVGEGNNPGLAQSVGTVALLRPYDVTAGRVPADADEAALDADTVARTGYALGDTITVLDPQQNRRALTLVGVVSFGDSKQYAGHAVVLLTQPALVALTGATGYREVVAVAAAGTPPQRLASSVAAVLPGTWARTGAQYRRALAIDAINQFSQFLTVLLIFGFIACVVCGFVISNTFNIMIAQRMREFALLRCVGATRRQVWGSVMAESAIVGLVGSVLGMAVGIGLGLGLFSGTTALGAQLPSHALVLTPTPVLVALLLGVAVTVGAALIPAVRATRVPPLAALRVMALDVSRRRAGRLLLVAGAALVGALGTLLTVLGSTSGAGARRATLLVVVGGVLNFLALLLLSPLFIGRLTALAGWLPARLLGTPVRLAVANARRNPGRTATTTAALMVGVGLMSAATVALATVRTTATQQLTEHYPVDYVLQSRGAGDSRPGIPMAVAQRLRGRGELRTVAESRLVSGALDGRDIAIGTLDPTGMAAMFGHDGGAQTLASGSTANFGPGTVILFTGAAAAHGKRVGDTVTLTAAGHSGRYRVAALATGGSQTGDAMLGWDDFAALHPGSLDDMLLIQANKGVTPAQSRRAVESVTDDYPLVQVRSLADWRSEITSSVDTLIGVVAALLGVAILISLIGITNTLSLSVVERTGESATLRALGLTRTQLRGMLLAEALLIGVVGAAVGMSFGLLYGWATTRVLFSGFAAVITVPVGQLLGYLAVAGVAAVIAAVLPARRAARASVVAAMAQA